MRRPVLSHLGTGFMALILAVVLWGFARLENREEVKVTFRVELTASQPYKVVPETKDIEIAIGGPRRFVDAFRAERHVIRKLVDPDVVRKAGAVDIDAADLDLGPRLTAAGLPVRIEPVDVSEQVTRQLPLKFKTIGTPAPGYAFSPERSYIRPPSVKVTGSSALLNKLDGLYVDDVDITDAWSATDLVTWQVPIPTSIEGERVSVDTTLARVYVAFDPKLAAKTLADIPVGFLISQGSSPYAVSTSPAAVTVTVEGTEQKLVTLEPANVYVFVQVGPGDAPRELPYTRKPEVILPAGVTVKSLQPDSVDLIVTGQTQ